MRAFGATIVMGVALWCASAAADPDDRSAQARVLFAEARERMAAGDWEAARGKLEASQKMFPGKGILYNLAVCYEHTGRLASAWTRYLEVAAAERREGDEARAEIATADAARIESRVPKLTIQVLHETPDLHVEYDGTVLEAAALGTALPLNPGTHVVEASAPNRVPKTFTIELRESERSNVDIDELELLQASPPIARAPIPHRARSSWMRPTAVVAGSLGLGALTAGAIFAVAAGVAYSDSSTDCNASGACTSQRGVDLRAQSLAYGDASTVLFVVGGGLVLTGLALWIFAPDKTLPKTALVEF